MKQTIKTSRAAGQLEKMFRMLNAHFFNNALPEPIITLKKTPGAYGHITTAKTWQAGSDRRYEINISTATLDRPIEETTATLLHEMCHLYNLEHNVKDTSGHGGYHNKRFKAAAEGHGLSIDYVPRYGWTRTTPTLELLDFVEAQGWSSIQMAEGYNTWTGTGTSSRSGGQSNGGTARPPKKPSSTRKYVCPICNQSVRATKMVNILCGDCTVKMKLVQ